MKQNEIKQLSTTDLVEKLKEERTMLQKLQFGHAVSPLENPMKVKTSRKLVARYLTELNRRKKEQA
jgi:large subunit ribosomal protein L29